MTPFSEFRNLRHTHTSHTLNLDETFRNTYSDSLSQRNVSFRLISLILSLLSEEKTIISARHWSGQWLPTLAQAERREVFIGEGVIGCGRVHAEHGSGVCS
ncbi:hypothetical protein AAHE18_02G181700 [Arachis hypogaea]